MLWWVVNGDGVSVIFGVIVDVIIGGVIVGMIVVIVIFILFNLFWNWCFYLGNSVVVKVFV